MLPHCVQSPWPRPPIHLLIVSFLHISFEALVVQPKDNHVENKHRFFFTKHCQLMLGKHRKAHNKLKHTLSLQRVCGDLQRGGWVCQQPSVQHWGSVKTTPGGRASFLKSCQYTGLMIKWRRKSLPSYPVQCGLRSKEDPPLRVPLTCPLGKAQLCLHKSIVRTPLLRTGGKLVHRTLSAPYLSKSLGKHKTGGCSSVKQ